MGLGWTLQSRDPSSCQVSGSNLSVGTELERIQLPAGMPVEPLDIQQAVPNFATSEQRQMPNWA